MKILENFSKVFSVKFMFINASLVNITILYPLKTPESQTFCGVFRGYKMKTLARNILKSDAFNLQFSRNHIPAREFAWIISKIFYYPFRKKTVNRRHWLSETDETKSFFSGICLLRWKMKFFTIVVFLLVLETLN